VPKFRKQLLCQYSNVPKTQRVAAKPLAWRNSLDAPSWCKKPAADPEIAQEDRAQSARNAAESKAL
jgi:hypothetical protein